MKSWFKAISYFLVSGISLFCFIHQLINNKQEFICSIEIYTTIGCFLFYGYLFYLEIKSETIRTSESITSSFCLYFLRFQLSYKFLFAILTASFLNFIIIESLQTNFSNFNKEFLVVLVMNLMKGFLPFFNVIILSFAFISYRSTIRRDITAMFLFFFLYFVLNLVLKIFIFYPNSEFWRIFEITLFNALLMLFFSISGLSLHDYLFKVNFNETLL